MQRKLIIDRDGIAVNEDGVTIGRVEIDSRFLRTLFMWRQGSVYVVTDTREAMIWELAGVYACQVEWPG
jgi:virulence-associated protein VapD